MYKLGKLEICPVVGVARFWNVDYDGEPIGFIERAAISLTGGPEWFAWWLPAPVRLKFATVYPSAKRWNVPFSGEFGNVEAVQKVIALAGETR